MVLLQIDSDQAAQIDLEVSLITTWKDVQVTPRPNVRLLSGPEGHHHRKHIFCPLKEASFQPAFCTFTLGSLVDRGIPRREVFWVACLLHLFRYGDSSVHPFLRDTEY